jgi:hypothetical protein
MAPAEPVAAVFPTPLTAYPPASPDGLLATYADRLGIDPFNAIATGIFVLAILHTFGAAKFVHLAHRIQHDHDTKRAAAGLPARPSTAAEFLHFFGEIEVVFGLWAVALVAAIAAWHGWPAAKGYLNHGVVFTEALFVVVIMALAGSRPIIVLAEGALRRLANLGGGTPAAWWFTILTVGPLLGSFITEPAAMTICALLLGRQFYDLKPGRSLKYATLGLLFVNVSIGGTLTHFAAPPVLMVARLWEWNTAFMLGHFGWRAVVAILVSNVVYFAAFRREFSRLAAMLPAADLDASEEDGTPALEAIPAWVTLVHVLFIAWTVANAHYPVLFIGGFLFFIGFAKATAPFQSRIDLKSPLLVGFFLGGLVIHGGLQGWWIEPLLASLSDVPLFLGAAALTAFNDNALITYLATLVPNLAEPLKVAVVGGAVAGGGLTVIANAPNPAGQALLSRFFGGAIVPGGLLLGALPATIVAALAFLLT